MNNPERKIRQVFITADTEHQQGSFVVVCEDGTLWDRTWAYKGPEGGNKGDHTLYGVAWQRIEGPPAEEANRA